MQLPPVLFLGEAEVMAKSDYVMCRRATFTALNAGKSVVVTAYMSKYGVRYTDPVTNKPVRKAKSVLYRVRVRLKSPVAHVAEDRK